MVCLLYLQAVNRGRLAKFQCDKRTMYTIIIVGKKKKNTNPIQFKVTHMWLAKAMKGKYTPKLTSEKKKINKMKVEKDEQRS